MSDELPVGWTKTKRAIVEARVFDGKLVQHVIGWVVARPCGCYLVLGMRIDKREPTTGVGACERHEVHVRRAFDYLTNSPPSEQEIGQMFAEALEREIEIAPA